MLKPTLLIFGSVTGTCSRTKKKMSNWIIFLFSMCSTLYTQ